MENDMIAGSYVAGAVRDLTKLRPEHVDLVECAHRLACINRFTGGTKYPYSVAQHAVLVSYLVTPGLEYEGLHHDTTEAFIGDIASPVKRNLVWAPGQFDAAVFEKFQAFEWRVRQPIAIALGLVTDEPDGVKRADAWALRIEQAMLQDRVEVTFSRPDHLPYALTDLVGEMTWRDAKALFLARHFELGGPRVIAG